MNFYHLSKKNGDTRLIGKDGEMLPLPQVIIKDVNALEKIKSLKIDSNLLHFNSELLQCELQFYDNIEISIEMLDYYGIERTTYPLVSKKFKKIVEENHLIVGDGHMFYPCKLNYQGLEHDYYFFQFTLKDYKLGYESNNSLELKFHPSKKMNNALIADQGSLSKHIGYIQNASRLKMNRQILGKYDEVPKKVYELKIKRLEQYEIYEDAKFELVLPYFMDMYRGPLGSKIIISKRFKTLLEENSIKGIVISKTIDNYII